jgi:LPS O-antigen subunit length determinant protein (WzzB/FepE family)
VDGVYRFGWWIAGCGSVFAVLLYSVSLLAARSYVRGEYLDLNGAREWPGARWPTIGRAL